MAWFRKMGVESVEYHRRTVLRRSDDHPGQALGYYGSGGETPLRWGGRLADRLGLAGAVDDADYGAVFGPGGARDPHDHTVNRLEADKAIQALDRVAGSGIHGRLAAINHELAGLYPHPPDLRGFASQPQMRPGLSL